ncbi:hypothetical protein [Salinispora arenicola]|uniref:hypothetical protein n=1 Tax=Salinispora arenicola TaxID=168697 RepID=UPI0027DB7BB1|nr:hypothetical protein [Salinispora arenicola]
MQRIIPATDLRLLGRSPEEFVTSLIVAGLLGLAVPSVVLGLLGLMGRDFGTGVPVVAALGFAALLIVIVYRDVGRKTVVARRECRRAVCAFIDLVALQRAAGRGTEESLSRAASKGSGWVFARIRQTLLRAELSVSAPWDGLKKLGTDLGVPELGDLGDISRQQASPVPRSTGRCGPEPHPYAPRSGPTNWPAQSCAPRNWRFPALCCWSSSCCWPSIPSRPGCSPRPPSTDHDQEVSAMDATRPSAQAGYVLRATRRATPR